MTVVIIGAGGHGAVVADILLRMRESGDRIEVVAFIDDDESLEGTQVLALRVITGGLHALRTIEHDAAIVAIGDNTIRYRIGEELRRSGTLLAIARHPASVVAPSVDLGPGTVVCAGAVVNPMTRIGTSVIVNTHASVDHHNSIGDCVHLAPGVHLGGNVAVGDETLVGIGSTVLPGITIGAGSIIGAGSVVTRDITDGVLALGAPAKVRRRGGRTPEMTARRLPHPGRRGHEC
jgi:sugar O-acyltransferase (sialic acid O-acetyltransferase NeuD family)